MKFEYELPSSAFTPVRQRILKIWTYTIGVLITISLICGFAMQWQCVRFNTALESAKLRSEVPDQLIQQRIQLHEQLKIYEMQPEKEIIHRLNAFLENLSRTLPEGAHLNELRSDESGILSLSGEVPDLASFKILTEPTDEIFWTFESSHLTQIRDSLYKFNLEYRLLTTSLEP